MRITQHYNRKITIYRTSTADDGLGSYTDKDSTPLFDVYANVMPTAGREDFVNEMYLNYELINFKIRYKDNIRPTDTVGYKGQQYEIISLEEVGRRSELIIRTKRKLNDGGA